MKLTGVMPKPMEVFQTQFFRQMIASTPSTHRAFPIFQP